MIDLPVPVRRYFDVVDGDDPEALLALLTPDVVVVDDGATWQSHDGVRQWRAEVVRQWDYTTELTGVRMVGAATHVVTGHIEGNFPGGEVDLFYSFTLVGDLIARLVISPDSPEEE
jgi:ketosteroid isomerase-like protein